MRRELSWISIMTLSGPEPNVTHVFTSTAYSIKPHIYLISCVFTLYTILVVKTLNCSLDGHCLANHCWFPAVALWYLTTNNDFKWTIYLFCFTFCPYIPTHAKCICCLILATQWQDTAIARFQWKTWNPDLIGTSLMFMSYISSVRSP